MFFGRASGFGFGLTLRGPMNGWVYCCCVQDLLSSADFALIEHPTPLDLYTCRGPLKNHVQNSGLTIYLKSIKTQLKSTSFFFFFFFFFKDFFRIIALLV